MSLVTDAAPGWLTGYGIAVSSLEGSFEELIDLSGDAAARRGDDR